MDDTTRIRAEARIEAYETVRAAVEALGHVYEVTAVAGAVDALIAAEKGRSGPPPLLELERFAVYPGGDDYDLWVGVAGMFDVHLMWSDEGVIVDVWPDGQKGPALDDPLGTLAVDAAAAEEAR